MTELTPIRRGRCADGTDWREQYRALTMTAEQAAQQIRNGDILGMTGAANWPDAFDQALARRLRRTGEHIELNSQFLLKPGALLAPELKEQVFYNTNFFVGERRIAAQGNLHFTPTHLSQNGAWFASRHPRVLVLTCSAPDENGWMCRSLWGAQMDRALLEQCQTLLVEVNDQMPVFASEGESHLMLHVSEADGILLNSHPPMSVLPAVSDETDEKIAGYIADLVPDGGCLQFGLGGLADAVGRFLADAGKKDLGMQSEVVGNCVLELMKKGVLNNSRKQTCPGKVAGAYLIGDQNLWEYAAGNPSFSFKEINWINDPRNIARNDNVVSINNAMEVDLTGQVNAETIGSRQFSGTGGQLEWVIGSQWSRGGKSIIALKSTYRDRQGILRSKIKPELPLGSVVTTPRTFVQYVVTEYGVANLKFKSTLERARALIAIAHPDFREELGRNLPL